MVEIILLLILAIFLIVVSAVVPVTRSVSRFELERKDNSNSNPTTTIELNREQFFGDIVSLQRVVTSFLLVIIVIICVTTFGMVMGAIVAFIIAIEYSAAARLPLARATAQKYYLKYEKHILQFIASNQKIFWWLRTVVPEIGDTQLASKTELEHLVETSGDTLSKDEKNMILHSLRFDTRRVSEIMTPRSVVDTIKKSEILGPLVLDSLHKTGHSRFPVIDGDIDHVVGTLYLRDVLRIDTRRKHTSTAETAMDKRVYYINEDQSLPHALTAFLKTHHHLFIVVNEFRETVGILTLEDTVEMLLGRPIIDEFDAHDNLREVAARMAKDNNKTSASAKNV